MGQQMTAFGTPEIRLLMGGLWTDGAEHMAVINKYSLASSGGLSNAVSPSPVDNGLSGAGKPDEAEKRAAAMSPFEQNGTPAEGSKGFRFLVSGQPSGIHGQLIKPNGGVI
jgi:NAD(P)-dependent dehydrogenase (short-subunit alcohol dehydrogenase family)